MKKVLETNRLYLREMTAHDLTFLTSLHQDPEVMKYIGTPRTDEAVAKRLDLIIRQYSEMPGFGAWMGCRKDDHKPIGWACLKDLDGTKDIEVGYRLATQCWGKGYATELAKALVKYGFENHRLSKISGVANPDNRGSLAVLRKAGLIFRSKARYYESEVDFFSLTRKSWSGTQD